MRPPRSRRGRRSAGIRLAGVLALALARPAPAQFSVSPVVVQIAATDAEAVRLTVRNEGENALQFRAYGLDFDMSADGRQTFWDPGSRPESCAARLRISPDAFSVGAGSESTIAVRLEPAASSATCWSAVMIETSASAEGTILVNQRIGVHVYGLSPEGDPDGDVVEGAVDVTATAVNVGFIVRNLGEWPLRPRGVVEIRDATGRPVTERPIDAFSVLPDREREISVAVAGTDLPPGRYLAVPILDWGGEYLAGTQIDFRVED